ncbi:hypothetical protein [Halogeometricum limi]|uniref:DUF8027 domain-containing protein n=1 Tax=Halogeometricum limi TaxID=555875 RepID=A0A1I6IJ04_9EURY|nr:hypothetical protein [Halogeometricum limi]SFR66280.1 hypothetical protein SAMN04488124_3227 [Halogeometricum limi]
MSIPGYDLDELDDRLETALAGRDLDRYLTADERARYAAGADLVDLLSGSDIRDILRLTRDEG